MRQATKDTKTLEEKVWDMEWHSRVWDMVDGVDQVDFASVYYACVYAFWSPC